MEVDKRKEVEKEIENGILNEKAKIKEEKMKEVSLSKGKEKEKESIPQKKESLNPLWTEKYKPTGMGEIIGNKSSANRLLNWLTLWSFFFFLFSFFFLINYHCFLNLNFF